MRVIQTIIMILAFSIAVSIVVIGILHQHLSGQALIAALITARIALHIYRYKKGPKDTTPLTPRKRPSKPFIGFLILVLVLPGFGIGMILIESAQGRECYSQHPPEQSVKICTKALSPLIPIQSDAERAHILAARGLAYAALGENALAMQDYDAALRLESNAILHAEPIAVATLESRGTLAVFDGRFHDAIQDFNQIIDNKLYDSPTFIKAQKADGMKAGAFALRGISNYYIGDPAKAANDLAMATQIKNIMLVQPLWLHIARVHAVQNDQEEFTNNSAAFTSEWPAPIYALYQGKATVEDVFAKAKVGDAKAQNDQMCDANFYVAQFYLLSGKKTDANPLLQAATTNCPVTTLERKLAHTEIVR